MAAKMKLRMGEGVKSMYEKVKNTDYEPYKKQAYEYKSAAGSKMSEIYQK